MKSQYPRFSDIPQFTREADQPSTMPWAQLEDKLAKWATYGDHGLQIQPDFQRAHVWGEGRSAKYVEYILRGGKSARDIYFNLPGWMGNWKGEFVVVDGQQRLTAALMFLRNELPVFGGMYRRDFADSLPYEASFSFHVNNLKTRAEVLQWYLDLNEGGIAHTDQELARVREMLKAEQK